MTKKTCSFCGRSESEVRLLITGLNGYICEDCAKQAYDIVRSAGVVGAKDAAEDKEEPFKLKKVPKPKEIKKYLDEYIIGQDEPSVSFLFRCIIIISACNSLQMMVELKLKRAISSW